jgi:hypothetical protein
MWTSVVQAESNGGAAVAVLGHGGSAAMRCGVLLRWGENDEQEEWGRSGVEGRVRQTMRGAALT